MAKGKIYFKGLTKTKTREKVRSIVNPVNFGDEFESEFISDLIIEKHYFCSRKKLRPSKFRKVPRKGPGYNFEGYFLQQRWHKVSWDKCITTPNLNSWATEALRLKIQPILFKYKEKHPVCEKCRELNSEHVDHVKPEFKEICEEALSLMSESEWDIAFYAFDWWNDAPFKLPECNSALIFTLETHKSTILQAVCKDCHLNNARERKLSINTYSKG